MELFEELNWLAVLGCVVAAMALGFLWYGPLFGKTWSAMMGWGEMSDEDMKAMQAKAMPGYAVMVVGATITSVILHRMLHAFGAGSVGAAVAVAALAWLGFVATSTLATAMFSQQNKRLWAINEGYVLVQLVLMAVILAMWS